MANIQILGIVFVWMLVWPIIVNSQPGSQFWYFRIDWKADNLDNTLFWTAIILMIVSAAVQGYNEKDKKTITKNIYTGSDGSVGPGV